MMFSDTACASEKQILAAMKAGRMTPEMERHVRECAVCSETVQVSSALLSVSSQVKVERGDARIIWLLAAERRHAETEQRLGRVIGMVPVIAAVILAIAAAVWRFLMGGSTDALLGGSGKIGPVFLVAAALVVFVVLTAPVRGRSS